MNNEMTLDKAVKLSDEELGTVAGGVGLRDLDERNALLHNARLARSQRHNTGLCTKYYLKSAYPASGAWVKVKYIASGADCE